MTYMVAFDDSPLARAALRRAAELADATGEEVLAVSVVPGDYVYARDRGWVEPNQSQSFAVDDVVAHLAERVDDLAPDAAFRPERVAKYAGTYTVSRRLQRVVKEVVPRVLFIGSENAGRIVTPLSNVSTKIASNRGYDVYIVCHPDES
jgi:nucleotide-binding universal stress UspA family protein